MEYAGSYALFNYRLEDPALGMESSNLRLIRAFEYGLDPTSSEAGFVLVHVDMVKNSGPLVAGTVASLAALSSDAASGRREAFNAGLRQVRDALARINEVMEGMWGRSKPRAYTHFRTFIFGITSQSMFPRGVRYEGVELERADEDGRVKAWLPYSSPQSSGEVPVYTLEDVLGDITGRSRWTLRFDTEGYFAAQGRETFFPEVTVVFEVAEGQHYHVPLLLAPFSYSHDRGRVSVGR